MVKTGPHTFFRKTPNDRIINDLLISRSEDWDYSFAIMHGGRPVDLSSAILEMYIRPSFGSAALFRRLVSGGSGEIIIDDAENGLAGILVTQANVRSSFPIGVHRQFLRIVEAGRRIEVWRGKLTVLAGNTQV